LFFETLLIQELINNQSSLLSRFAPNALSFSSSPSFSICAEIHEGHGCMGFHSFDQDVTFQWPFFISGFEQAAGD